MRRARSHRYRIGAYQSERARQAPHQRGAQPQASRGAAAASLRRVSGAVGNWLKHSKASMVQVVLAVAVLVAAFLGSLALHTQMTQNSFQASRVQENITRLSQDVSERQSTLDNLQASLLQKAEKMGMIPQQGTVSINLEGYHSPIAPDATHSTQGAQQ